LSFGKLDEDRSELLEMVEVAGSVVNKPEPVRSCRKLVKEGGRVERIRGFLEVISVGTKTGAQNLSPQRHKGRKGRGGRT
jgi:hypothetical protein